MTKDTTTASGSNRFGDLFNLTQDQQEAYERLKLKVLDEAPAPSGGLGSYSVGLQEHADLMMVPFGYNRHRRFGDAMGPHLKILVAKARSASTLHINLESGDWRLNDLEPFTRSLSKIDSIPEGLLADTPAFPLLKDSEVSICQIPLSLFFNPTTSLFNPARRLPFRVTGLFFGLAAALRTPNGGPKLHRKSFGSPTRFGSTTGTTMYGLARHVIPWL